MNSPVAIIALVVVAYLLGSIPFGLLIVRWVVNIDVRQSGSGNIGATNVRRVAGTLWGIVTLVCDVLKGALPTYAATIVTGPTVTGVAPWVALAAICGHMFPIYFKFKPSGKGVATALGCFAVLSAPACGVALAVFLCIVFISRRVSAASMGSMAMLPVAIAMITRDPMSTLAAALAAAMIISRHKDNIQRLLSGKEPPIGKTH
ncbi:MAG: glycerol-3-phosphate 1-O-acyltransferase PlsY [Desulfobacteraceae bacterium]|jgi:glycerol-3-phosphate acyltransferase PlsY